MLGTAADGAEIDPYQVDIDEVQTMEELVAVEACFADVIEIQGLLKNCRHCFHQVVNVELRRLHTMAALSREEFLHIDADVRFAARKAILDIGQQRLTRMQLNKMGSSGGNSLGQLATVTKVEDFILKAAGATLPEERISRYRDEVDDRRMHRQKGLVAAITSSLDSRLFLSAEQRSKIRDVLKREWHDAWLLCVRQLLVRGVETLPLLPKAQIADELSSAQKQLFWNLTWNPTRPPYFGPSAATMAGHRNRDVRLVDELEFATADREGQR